MEHFVKKLLVATGILAAASVTMLPLASHAADSATTTVTVNVQRTISLDAASGGDTINLVANQVNTGNISATVTSTAPYTISLSATQPNLVHSTLSSRQICSRASRLGLRLASSPMREVSRVTW